MTPPCSAQASPAFAFAWILLEDFGGKLGKAGKSCDGIRVEKRGKVGDQLGNLQNIQRESSKEDLSGSKLCLPAPDWSKVKWFGLLRGAATSILCNMHTIPFCININMQREEEDFNHVPLLES